jgi:hypothetical protein
VLVSWPSAPLPVEERFIGFGDEILGDTIGAFGGVVAEGFLIDADHLHKAWEYQGFDLVEDPAYGVPARQIGAHNVVYPPDFFVRGHYIVYDLHEILFAASIHGLLLTLT